MSGRFVHLVVPTGDRQGSGRAVPPGLGGRLLAPLARLLPLHRAGRITVRSPCSEAEGWLISLCFGSLLPEALSSAARRIKATEALRVARRLGASVAGLGALASALDEHTVSLARSLSLSITTGATLSAALAPEAVQEAARLTGLDLGSAEVAVLGATGPAGRAYSLSLAEAASRLTLVGSDVGALERVAGEVLREAGVSAQVSTNPQRSLPKADVIVTVPGSDRLNPVHVRGGAVVLDVAGCLCDGRSARREDVIVFRGCLVELPGGADFASHGGYAEGACDAGLAETILMALEGPSEPGVIDSWNPVCIKAMRCRAARHGLRLAGLVRPAGITVAGGAGVFRRTRFLS